MKRRVLIGLAALLSLTLSASLVEANSVGPISCWPFDGHTNDVVGSNHGTNHGASFVPGVYGAALYFDGTTYVEVPNAPSLEPVDTITVAAWVKRLGSPGGAKYIVSKYLPNRHGSHSSYGLYSGSGGLRFYVGHYSGWKGSPQASASLIWDGAWHCVAGTFDGMYLKLYVDGNQIPGATEDLQDIYYEASGNLFFGHYYPGDWLAFSGTVDEVRLWNRALTLDEVTRNCQLRLIDIDIKPGSDPNCFNNDGHGVIPVAILGSADFCVTDIDPASVALQGMAVKAVGKSNKLLASIEDVNGDGFDDLVVKIEDTDATFTSGSGTATLTGQLWDSTPFEGSDSICIVP